MKDVAALAGVSIKTVSRVVNGEAGVSAAVRERVSAAAERLDYRHNLAASNLRRQGGRTGMVGALVQDVSNSFSAGLIRGLEKASRERGTAILTASIDEAPEREQALVHDLVTRRVDGLVIVPASERQDYLASELRAGLPAIFVDRRPRGVDADSVTVDNVGGAALATGHLLDRGHRRVAVITDLSTIPTAAERVRGHAQAHVVRGLVADPALVVGDVRNPDAAAEAVTALLALADPPTAFFAGRNIIAAGAARALRRLGRQHTVALVGFDDFPNADLLDPALTVVRQDVDLLAEAATERLFARIDGDDSPPRHLVLPCSLVERGSGELPPPGA